MNTKGSQTLFQASSECKLRLVRMLVEGGTPVDAQNVKQETPLMLCCQSEANTDEKCRVVSYLLRKSAKVNLQDASGRTALIHACLSNSGTSIIKTLLDFKSNPWIADKTNNTVFDYAINAQDLETTRLLINSCRESRMFCDGRENVPIKHLEECLANIQDLRKFSWPLVGPSLRSSHAHVYLTENDNFAVPVPDMFRDELSESNSPPRLRKRSVCQFDPLDLYEVLNCDDNENISNFSKEAEETEDKEQRKTSIRSLSEEERFSFHLSDTENAPSDLSSGLEKLLKLQDSFSSSLDSNEVPYSLVDSRRNSTSKCTESSFDKESQKNTETTASELMETERKIVLANRQDKKNFKQTSELDRVFITRIGAELTKGKDNSSDVSFSDKPIIDGSTPTMIYNMEYKSSPQLSPSSSCQSSPARSPYASPQLRRRKTLASVTLKQNISPQESALDNSEKNQREASIIRRYTLSSLEGGKLQSTGIQQKLSPPSPKDAPFASETEMTNLPRAFTQKASPPGLRKSKSDLTDWRSMYSNVQGKEQVEYIVRQKSVIHIHQQCTEQAQGEIDVQSSQLQLPNIPPAKKGRQLQKDFTYSIPVISHAESMANHGELSYLWAKNSDDKQRLSPQNEDTLSLDNTRHSQNPRRLSFPSSPRDTRTPQTRHSFDSCDVVSAVSDLPGRGWEKVSGDVVPDLLSNIQASEESTSKYSTVRTVSSTLNTDLRPAKEPSSPTAKGADDRCAGPKRTSPRLRPATLLPPLIISQRRSPTHEMEDGYFSCSPSPADFDSPRRKSSNEQLRYSFRPISPRSPIRSTQAFNLQSGKPSYIR